MRFQEATLPLGCAGLIGLVFFLISLAVSLFTADTVGEGLMMAGMVGAMAFVASLFLFMTDRGRFSEAKARVCRSLLAERDMSDDEFLPRVSRR